MGSLQSYALRIKIMLLNCLVFGEVYRLSKELFASYRTN